MLLQMLSGEKKMRVIASGAIGRLQEYTKRNKDTLISDVTNHTDEMRQVCGFIA